MYRPERYKFSARLSPIASTRSRISPGPGSAIEVRSILSTSAPRKKGQPLGLTPPVLPPDKSVADALAPVAGVHLRRKIEAANSRQDGVHLGVRDMNTKRRNGLDWVWRGHFRNSSPWMASGTSTSSKSFGRISQWPTVRTVVSGEVPDTTIIGPRAIQLLPNRRSTPGFHRYPAPAEPVAS